MTFEDFYICMIKWWFDQNCQNEFNLIIIDFSSFLKVGDSIFHPAIIVLKKDLKKIEYMVTLQQFNIQID